jgi:hypothetical protein
VIDGGGAPITTGPKGVLRMPNIGLTLGRGALLADTTGSIKVDIWKDGYANFPPDNTDSICAGHELEISGAVKDEDTSLTGWGTTLAARDIVKFNVDSCSTITRCTVSLEASET